VGARNVSAWQLMSSFDRETATHSVGGLTGTIGILRIEHSETLTSCNSFVAQFPHGVSVSDLSPPSATGRAVPLGRGPAEIATRTSRRPEGRGRATGRTFPISDCCALLCRGVSFRLSIGTSLSPDRRAPCATVPQRRRGSSRVIRAEEAPKPPASIGSKVFFSADETPRPWHHARRRAPARHVVR